MENQVHEMEIGAAVFDPELGAYGAVVVYLGAPESRPTSARGNSICARNVGREKGHFQGVSGHGVQVIITKRE